MGFERVRRAEEAEAEERRAAEDKERERLAAIEAAEAAAAAAAAAVADGDEPRRSSRRRPGPPSMVGLRHLAVVGDACATIAVLGPQALLLTFCCWKVAVCRVRVWLRQAAPCLFLFMFVFGGTLFCSCCR